MKSTSGAHRKPASTPASTKIIVRIQSPTGTKRCELLSTDTIASLQKQVQEAFGLPPTSNGTKATWQLFRDRQQTQPLLDPKPRSVTATTSQSLNSAKIQHGDMLFLKLDTFGSSLAPSSSSAVSLAGSTSSASLTSMTDEVMPKKSVVVPLDEVDEHLLRLDGKIERQRDEKYCRHAGHSKCVHCTPLDPYDEEYLLKREIKHMSFHAHLRKVLGDQQRQQGKMPWSQSAGESIEFTHGHPSRPLYPHPLEEISCRIKSGCSGHPPWPAGICTKCQPNTVTLMRQRYRHVDNISFENQYLVNRFLDGWRHGGTQRIGLLLGRYEPHTDVPLGIRAIVAAIYEPPQLGVANAVEFAEEDDSRAVVDEIAKALNLRVIGWIFTDLTDEGGGHVAYNRHIGSYLLSAEECITAGWLQSLNPNPCPFASDGYFGSKFVTVVVTGDREENIHFEGYQVSNQCTALVRDQCLVPTIDAPELAYVRESTNEQYVPDVFFKEKDSYGNDSQRIGRPLPVEYLIVDVPASMPKEPEFTFAADAKFVPFPVENRAVQLDEVQGFRELCAYRRQFSPNQFYEFAADFHLLLFLCTNVYAIDVFAVDELRPLLDAIMRHDRAAAYDWSRTSPRWRLLEQRMQTGAEANGRAAGVDVAGIGAAGGDAEPGAAAVTWSCDHCTYLNDAARMDCEMCGLPRVH